MILLIVLFSLKCILSWGGGKKSHIQLNFHRIQESRKSWRICRWTMWRNKFVSTRASTRGPRVPRVEARHVCVRQARFCFFLLSFTQLKRIKVCFFFFLLPPNIITGYEMSHSGVWETQQWRRKNLFIRLWLPEHCPVETGRETNTHTHKHTQRDTCRYIQKKKTSKFISSFFHSFIWTLMYSFLCQSLFQKKSSSWLFFLFMYSKAVFTVGGGGKCLNAKALVLLWQSGRLTPPPPSWTPSFLW